MCSCNRHRKIEQKIPAGSTTYLVKESFVIPSPQGYDPKWTSELTIAENLTKDEALKLLVNI